MGRAINWVKDRDLHARISNAMDKSLGFSHDESCDGKENVSFIVYVCRMYVYIYIYIYVYSIYNRYNWQEQSVVEMCDEIKIDVNTYGT